MDVTCWCGMALVHLTPSDSNDNIKTVKSYVIHLLYVYTMMMKNDSPRAIDLDAIR